MKPKPGFWRWRNIIWLTLGVSLLVFCVWGAWAVHWAFNAQPGSSVDYAAKAEALVASYQADVAHEPNGWEELSDIIQRSRDTYASYLDTLREPNTPLHLLPRPADWPKKWSWPPDAEDVLADGAPESVMTHARAIVEGQARADIFHQIANLRSRRFFSRPVHKGVLLEHLRDSDLMYRQFARLLSARQRLAHMDGDMTTLADAFDDAFTVARAVGRQYQLIDRLQGMAIRSAACKELRHELIEQPVHEAILERLLQTLGRIADEPGIEFALEGDRIAMLDLIQRTHTDDGQGDGRVLVVRLRALDDSWVDPGGVSLSVVNVFGLFLPTKSETTRVVHEFYDKAATLALVTNPASRAVKIREFEEWASSLPHDQPPARHCLQSAIMAIHASDAAALELAGTRLMLAIEIHRARTGVLPAALADLVPGILPALPVDPWNPDGIVYRPDASQPWGYTLYSKGADGVDDRAPYDEDTNMNALKHEGAGTDFHFVYPRYRVGN
ncbi:MAG: hypothetical protein HUU18_04575 [Phycisphaerales bacterium]|nr:hypothetical protein [Phycisphaerales bacterium]